MNLFQAGNIGTLSVKNRIVMSAMGMALHEPEGRFSKREIDYYEARAAGGVGLIISSYCAVEKQVEPKAEGTYCFLPMADNFAFLNRFSEFADAMHDYGTRLAIQLTPGFGLAMPLRLIEVMAPERPLAPSEQPCFNNPQIMARALTIEEIEKLVHAYKFAAKLMHLARVDAIEVHAMGGYLLDQFMSPKWNHRQDQYGGDLEGRLKFALEIVEAIKSSAGKNFPVIFKFAVKQYFEGGREVEESLEIVRRLEKAGVDALDVTGASFGNVHGRTHPAYAPPGQWAALAEAVKRVVKIPVIVGGALGHPDLAERVLQEAKADFISLGRPLLTDPEWPNKVKEKRFDDLKICIRDNEGCSGRRRLNKHASCTLTPATGMEKELAVTPAEVRKSVLVIGGGPAGMEAARVTALRGHGVTLWERGEELGGNLIPASVPEFKQEIKSLIAYLSAQIKKLGVKIELGKEATPELIRQINPQVLVMATGSIPYVPEISGISQGMEGGRVITAVDLLLGKKGVGERIVIAGGGIIGCEVGLYLAQKNKKVTIVEMLEGFASDAYLDNRTNLVYLLNRFRVNLFNKTTLVGITENGATVNDKSGMRMLEADTVVLALGMKSEMKLLKALSSGEGPVPIPIGDCVEPRRIINAIWEGFRMGRLI